MPTARGEPGRLSGGGGGTALAPPPTAVQTGRRQSRHIHRRRRQGRWLQRLWPPHPRPCSPAMTPHAPPRPASLSSRRRKWIIRRILKPSHRPL